MSQNIKDALLKLDTMIDGHWTSDGLPRLDSVKALVGDALLTRDMVSAAFPGFTRSVAAGGVPVATQLPSPVSIVAPAELTLEVQLPVAQEPTVQATEVGDPLQEAVKDLEVASAQLVETDKYLAEGNASRKKLLAKIDALSAQVDKLSPADTTTDAIQCYLASQRAILTARGEQHAKARAFEKEHGFKLAQLLPKRAPLDMAMARKTGRGGNRPGSK